MASGTIQDYTWVDGQFVWSGVGPIPQEGMTKLEYEQSLGYNIPKPSNGSKQMPLNGISTNPYAPITTQVTPLGFPGLDFLNPFTSSGLGLNIPTIALAYGAYNVITRRKRRNLMSLALLAYGLYGTGIIGSLTSGKQDLSSMAIASGAFALSPTIGAAAVGGLPMAIAALAGSFLSGRGGKKRRSYRRPYNNYRPRRRYYNRRRY